MREILFRGKQNNGEWVEGSLINAFEYTCILQSEDKLHPTDYPYLDGNIGTFDGKATPVIPETVGQYTGLTDKNGKKIFEGDIVELTVFDYNGIDTQYICEVLFNECGMVFQSVISEDCSFLYANTIISTEDEVEVIGNVHDNPEPMKGEQQC